MCQKTAIPLCSLYITQKKKKKKKKMNVFLIEDNDLLEKYNTILDKVSTDIKKGFNSRLSAKIFF